MSTPPTTTAAEEFVSFLAHEMKTPLTIIKGYAASLRRMLDGAEQEMATDIERETDRLNRLVNQLLDVSRIESGRLGLRCEEIEIVELLEDVVGRQRNSDQSRPFHIEAGHDELLALADESALRRVLEHLLANARQYSEPGKPVIVAAGAAGDCVEIAVRDQGPGILESELPRLTEKLFRGSGSTGEGLGLGLYIVEQLLVAQGGRLEIESRPGSGSTFRALLPAARGSPGESA